MPSSTTSALSKKPAPTKVATSTAATSAPVKKTAATTKKPSAATSKPKKTFDKKAPTAKDAKDPHATDKVEQEKKYVVVMDDKESIRLKEEMTKKAELEMEELRKAAWSAQLDYDRKQEEKQRKIAQEEAKRKKEEASLTKALLEAVFDGEDEEIDNLLSKAAMIFVGKRPIEASDGHGNSLISEASAGGSATTVMKLLYLGANPNAQGEFMRTPLWRSCFLGKVSVVTPLLEGGADPRIQNEGGELPIHVASCPEIKAILEGWDIARTDKICRDLKEREEKRAAQEKAKRAEALQVAENALSLAQKAYDASQKNLLCAREELEKRITEHDLCVEEKKGDEILNATLASIKVAEQSVEKAKTSAYIASEALDAARMEARENNLESELPSRDLPGIPIEVKDLDAVLLRDVGGKIAIDGRWPMVIDASGRSSVFLRYTDTNYINVLSMEPEKVRRSLLGALRYGKPLVLDWAEIDIWHQLPSLFDRVQTGLFHLIMTKDIIREEHCKKLIQPSEGEAYDLNQFQDVRLAAFKMIFITSNRFPNPEAMDALYTLRVQLRE